MLLKVTCKLFLMSLPNVLEILGKRAQEFLHLLVVFGDLLGESGRDRKSFENPLEYFDAMLFMQLHTCAASITTEEGVDSAAGLMTDKLGWSRTLSTRTVIVCDILHYHTEVNTNSMTSTPAAIVRSTGESVRIPEGFTF